MGCRKNAANIGKHGIDFGDARRVFDGFVLTAPDRRFDYGEDRKTSIGSLAGIVTVARTHRNGNIRIISARRASRRERNAYEEALRTAPDAGRAQGDA